MSSGEDNHMKRHLSAMIAGLALTAAAPAFAQDVTITNARIVESNGTVIDRGSIVVRGGRIVSVAPGAPKAAVGRIIDATGLTAVPGFIDGHKHINTGPLEKEQMQDLIEAGFTTVLSGGGPGDGNLTLREHIDSGKINGPRVIPSERVNLRGTPEQARAAIRAMAAKGIRNTGEIAVTPEPGPPPAEIAVLKAAVDEGAKAGVQVNVHAVSTPAMVAAVDAGIRRLVHLPNKDFMGYDDAAKIAGSGAIVLDTVSFGAPIIGVFSKDDTPRFRTGLIWPDSIAGANRDEKGRATGTEAAYALINARRIWDASGGKGLGYGSDQNYPVKAVLEHELKSLAVMFSMQDIFRILGPNTAAYIGMQDQIGTLEPGKLADIVLLRGDPLRDFHDMLKAEVVLKGGKVVVDKRRSASATPRKTPERPRTPAPAR
jgi:imidazolonepropionase-like amidohydrolase